MTPHDHHIHVGSDVLPDFGLHANAVALPPPAESYWGLRDTWASRDLPGEASAAIVPAGLALTVVGAAVAGSVCVPAGASLRLRRDATLRVGTLQVLEGGELVVEAGAEVIFLDRPFAADDPEQYGGGLICLGRLTVRGVPRTPFVRLAEEALPGHERITLEFPPTDWKNDDELLIAPTGPRGVDCQGRCERLAIHTIVGRTVYLKSPVRAPHRYHCPRDEKGIWLPHVVNVTRDTVFRSESPRGVRGHCWIGGAAEIDIRDAAFLGLGRTTADPSSRVGRYPLHLHHVRPKRLVDGTYHWRVSGCVIDSGEVETRYGLAIHDVHCGLAEHNVTVGHHQGIITEDGSESHNVIRGNYSCDNSGDAWWLNGARNHVTSNVAATSEGSGYYLPRNGNRTFTVPTPEGGEEEFREVSSTFLSFEHNEAYSCKSGFYPDHHSPSGEHHINNLRAWGTWGNDPDGKDPPWGQGVVHYDSGVLLYRDLVLRGSSFDNIETSVVHLYDPDIRGGWRGINDPSTGRLLIVHGGVLQNRVNARVTFPVTAKAVLPPPGIIMKVAIFRNVESLPMGDAKPRHLELEWLTDGAITRIPTVPAEVWVIDSFGLRGTWRVYWPEQHADAICPCIDDIEDVEGLVRAGCPERGLTNRESWEKYGVAVGGAVAPPEAVEAPGIIGLCAKE